ncbi:hypothetical protein Xekk_00973 [Xenorhabdus sp. KK7.4]|nr:hypothetical protein Xekk_00973 [Xenorhabdus sp. KK7.4]
MLIINIRDMINYHEISKNTPISLKGNKPILYHSENMLFIK